MHASYSRLNQSPSVACINHEFFLTWQNPFTGTKLMGMERRFCFAHSSTCNVTRECDNPLIRKLPTYRVHTRSADTFYPCIKSGICIPLHLPTMEEPLRPQNGN